MDNVYAQTSSRHIAIVIMLRSELLSFKSNKALQMDQRVYVEFGRGFHFNCNSNCCNFNSNLQNVGVLPSSQI